VTSYGLPDEVFGLSEEEQAKRAAPHGRNFYELKGEAFAPSRWFVRTLLPFAVDGRSDGAQRGGLQAPRRHARPSRGKARP